MELFHLFTLDVTPVGGEVYYIHQYNSDPITFNGNIYVPVPIETDGFEINSKSLPTPTIRISNVLGFVGTLVKAFDGLQGAVVTRHTLRTNISGYSYTNSDIVGLPDVYIIDRATSHTSVSISFELKSIFDFSGQRVPKRTILLSCPLAYGGAECSIPISSAYPTCPRNIAGCRDRAALYFGQPNPELPYGGFPGVNRFSG
jgi:lambda family phage minor tail protein L